MGTYKRVTSTVTYDTVMSLAELDSRVYGSCYGSIFRLNENEDDWESPISAAAPLDYAKLITYNSNLYLFNNGWGGAYLWRLNLAGNSVDQIVSDALGEDSTVAMVVFNNRLYGVGSSKTAPNDMEEVSALYRLNLAEDAWEKLATGFIRIPYYSHKAYLLSLVVFENRIYAGASDGKLYRLNLAENAWELVCNASDGHAVSVSALHVYGGRLYGSLSEINRIVRLNIAGNAWEFLCNSITHVLSFSVCYGRLYCGAVDGYIFRLNTSFNGLDTILRSDNYGVGAILNRSSDSKLYFGTRQGGDGPFLLKYNSVKIDYTANVTAGGVPLNVTFTPTVTSDYQILSYLWNFGDSGSSSAVSPTHAYNARGVYSPTLTVVDTFDTNSEVKQDYITVSTFYLNYDGNGNTGGAVPVDQRAYNEGDYAVVLTPGTLTSEGKTFKSWNEMAEGYSTNYSPGDSIRMSADITLYAIWDASPSAIDSYWDMDTSGLTQSSGGVGKSTPEMKSASTYNNWNFSTVWKIDENESYPSFFKANFSSDIQEGSSPLLVTFHNDSEGWPNETASIISHEWDFGDGSPHSFENHPTHSYALQGYYTVTLIESRNFLQDTRVKTSYIHVIGGVAADFSGSPRSGVSSLTVHFIDESKGNIESRLWNFGDGHYSSERNPTHYYFHHGIYTVSLTVSGVSGQSTRVKDSYISVNSTATYDIAPIQEKKAYLWGRGVVMQKLVGVEIRKVNR